jgi:cellulose 1,4-beta-cellobiosidase
VRAEDAAGNLSIASNTVRATGSTPTPTPTGTLPPPGPCTVVYRTRTQWTGGFVADVTVTNTGSTAVDGWTLTFPFAGDQQLTASWNATYRQAGIGVTLTALQWNRVIQPGGSVTVGLIGRWTTSNASPSSAALNGRSCTMA